MPELDKEILTCLDGRCETLDTTRWSYPCKLANTQRYGIDVAFSGTADIDEKRMSVWIPFADGNRRDGVGDLLEVEGIDTSRHRGNPIVLFDHGKEIKLPVALAEDPDTKAYTVEIDPVSRTARANAFFYQGKGLDSTTPSEEYAHAVFCEQLFDLLARRYIRAGSIGYQVVAAKQLQPDYERGTPQGLHLLRVLMLECSAVVLPANGDTVRKSFPVGSSEYGEWLEKVRQVLAMPQVCGKPLSPYLVKSLEPFAAKNKTVSGYEGKGIKQGQKPKVGDRVEGVYMPGLGDHEFSGRIVSIDMEQGGPRGSPSSYGLARIQLDKPIVRYGSSSNHILLTVGADSRVEDSKYDLKSQPSADIDPDKACRILHDGEANGQPLSDDQRRMFGAACSRKKNYTNPLSNSDVPPSRWKPGAGAIKEVRNKYRKKYVNVEFFRDRTQARQFADDLIRKRCKVSRFTQDPKTGQWGVYWDTNCGTSSAEQAGEYEDASNRMRGEPTTYRRSKSVPSDIQGFSFDARKYGPKEAKVWLDSHGYSEAVRWRSGVQQSRLFYTRATGQPGLQKETIEDGIEIIKQKSMMMSEAVTNAGVRRVLQAAGITPKAVTDLGDRVVVVVDRGRFDEAWKVLYNRFESVAADYNAIYVYHPMKMMQDNKAMPGDEDLRKRAFQAYQAANNQFQKDPGFWTGSPERSELEAAINQAIRSDKSRERAEGLRKFAEACRRLAPKAPDRSSRVSLEKAARHAEDAIGLYGQLEDFYRMNRKSLDDVRLKYRPGAKGRMRRLRKSSPGSALVYVSGKDLNKLRQAAEAKGIGFSRAGVKGDLEKVRLTGDDTVIDGIAKQFGKAVKMLTKALEGYAFVWDVTGFGPKIPGNKYGNREGFRTIRVMAHTKESAVATALPLLPENRREVPTAKQVVKQAIDNWTGPKANDIKSITTMKRKDMAEDNGTMNGTQATAGDADLNDDGVVTEQEAEKYGAQLLRDMHEVFMELMERWDKARGPLEQAKVDGHLEKVLTNLGDHLDKTEALFEEIYSDLDPLGDGEAKDMDTMDDAGTPADSDDERDDEEPTPDEAVEGMNTKRNKRMRVKAMPIRTKAKKKKGGKDSQWGARYQGAYEWAEENNYNDPEGTAAAIANGPKHLYHILTKSVCPDCGVADCKCGSKDMTQDEAQNLKEDIVEQVNDSELEPHEKRMVKEAAGFLGEVAETPEWTEEHRMKSYHYHKGLDPIGMLDEVIGGVTGEEGEKAANEVRTKPGYAGPSSRVSEPSVSPPSNPPSGQSAYRDEQRVHSSESQAEANKGMSSARKMCKDCSAFFKELSAVTELDDDYRGKAMYWHKQLGPFGEEAMNGEPDLMGSDEEPMPTEPGDMDTKALLDEVAEQDRLVKEMEKKLASISF